MSIYRILLVKTAPTKEGFGILQRLDGRTDERVQATVIKARDTWQRQNPDWAFKIVDPTHYGLNDRDAEGHYLYYSDNDPVYNKLLGMSRRLV